jgi:hypothetical protein
MHVATLAREAARRTDIALGRSGIACFRLLLGSRSIAILCGSVSRIVHIVHMLRLGPRTGLSCRALVFSGVCILISIIVLVHRYPLP